MTISAVIRAGSACVQEKLKIAVAGTGFGEKYMVGLQANPDVEVVGVFSRRPERAEAAAERFGIPFSTCRFGDLIHLPGLDAVAIVTPNSTHAEFVSAALAFGKHVICDKPLALNGQEAAGLRQAAQEAGVKHVTFVPYRYSPAALTMRTAVTEGHVGRVFGVRAAWGIDLRDEPLRWRFQRKLSGAGVVADLGAHVLDLVVWSLGPVRRVLGRCRTLIPHRPAEVGGRRRKVDVPDECCALLEFARAGVGSVNLSWNGKRDQRIEIEGHRGAIIYQSPSMLQWLEGRGEFNPTVTFQPSRGSPKLLPLAESAQDEFATPESALARMFRDIVSYLRGGEKTATVATFDDGAEVLKVIDAIERSDRVGGWVDL
jgi:predicted dehydrogenase